MLDDYEAVAGQSSEPPPALGRSAALPWLDIGAGALVCAWIASIAFVDPRGEFPINDDWSFQRALERLLYEGRLGSTGWGYDARSGGGPALLTQLLWTAAFVRALGYSFVTLRVAVLSLALVGTLAVYATLRRAGCARTLALWGTATLSFGPLFFSQSFTFMSDVPFASLLSLALLVLVWAIDRQSTPLLLLGQLLTLAAMLTRQLGLALPLALMALAFTHPALRRFGTRKVVLSTVAVVIVPWLAFEYALSLVGSTPVTQHAVTHRLFGTLESHPLRIAYIFVRHLFQEGIAYLAVLLLPLTLLAAPGPLAHPRARRALRVLVGICAALIAATALGLLHVPVLLNENVINPWGIGPLLLKDIYTLHVPRFAEIPQAAWCLVLLLAVISAALLVSLFARNVLSIVRARTEEPRASTVPGSDAADVAGPLSTLAFLLYMGVITLSGYQDRYLIPACALGVVALLSRRRTLVQTPLPFRIGAGAALGALAALALLGTRDFMEIKRSQERAYHYVRDVRHASICETDSGFEWNGYHCYQEGFETRPGFSSWWVTRERYLMALGPMPGYRVLETFPFERWLGADGALHVLEPDGANHTALAPRTVRR